MAWFAVGWRLWNSWLIADKPSVWLCGYIHLMATPGRLATSAGVFWTRQLLKGPLLKVLPVCAGTGCVPVYEVTPHAVQTRLAGLPESCRQASSAGVSYDNFS